MSEVTIYEVMLGKVFTSVQKGEDEDGDTLVFTDEENKIYTFHHEQRCCECVVIDDIIGDLNDLVNSPLLEAEEVVTYSTEEYESETHTWYKFATIKGCVTVKWHGSSNGYYSESVDFEITG